LPGAVEYLKAKRVWVEDGHVFVEGHDGVILRMIPEVAIHLGRLLSEAGADSFINKVMEKHEGSEPTSEP
jgi:hypothetical protein